jgi:hypothetical protein
LHSGRFGGEACNALYLVQGFHLTSEEAGKPQSFGHGYEDAGTGVAQNASLAPQVILEL